MLKEKIIKICDHIIEIGILAIIFFIPIIFDVTLSSYNFFDLYKVVVFRVILVFVLLAYTAKVFVNNKLSYKGSNKIFWLAGFLLLSFFISSFFSLQPKQSFWGSFLRQQGFYNFFNYLLFFVLLILNLRNFKQLRRLIITVISSASLAAVYGLVQYFNLDPLSWNASAINTDRIFSTLGQPNFFGHFLIMVLPVSLYALIFMAKGILARFFVGLALLMQLVCLIFTYSRAAWLGFIGSLVFLLIFWLTDKRFKKLLLGFIGWILIGAVSIVSLNMIRPAEPGDLNSIGLANRLKSITDLKGGSNQMRLYYLESAVKEIKQASSLRLLVGYGPETLAGVFMKYYQPDWGVHEAINTVPDRAHNWLFDQILALGVLGLAANLAFYSYLIYKAARFLLAKQKFGPDGWLLIFLGSSLTAYFINNLFSFSLFTVLVYLYLILASCWFVINHQAEAKTVNIRLTTVSKLLIWASLLAVSAVFIYTNNINQARAEIYYMKALRSMKLSDCQGVINNTEKTLNLSPNSSYYQENYLWLVLNCFSSIKNKAVQEQLRDNILARLKLINDQESYGILDNTARAYALFGFYLDKSYYGQAEKIFNNLIVNFPYLTTAYDDLGRQKIGQGDYEGAIEIFKRAVEILPCLDQPYLNDQHRRQIEAVALRLYENMGLAYFKIKNYDLALDYYKKGLSLAPDRATLYKNIADIYYVQGQLDKAIAGNKRGLMLNPADYHWPLALSLLYRDKKELAEAKKYLSQAIKLAPENKDLKKYEQELNK